MIARRLAGVAIVAGAACSILGIARAVSLRPIERAADRYGPARAALAGAREAGFVTDVHLAGGEGAFRFHRAALAVAPVLLRPDVKEPLLLADFDRPEVLERFLREPGVVLKARIGPGVAVVEQR